MHQQARGNLGHERSRGRRPEQPGRCDPCRPWGNQLASCPAHDVIFADPGSGTDVIFADRCMRRRGMFPASESRCAVRFRCDPCRPFDFGEFDVSVADRICNSDFRIE